MAKQKLEKGTHGSRELPFEQLDFIGQSRVINGQIQTIIKSINAHHRRVNEDNISGKKIRDVNEVRSKCINLLIGAINKVNP